MKVRALDVLHCDAGWRPWSFVKLTTDDGLVGWAECTDSHGSPHGIAGVVSDLAPLLVGKDPRPTERRMWELGSATRQSPGGVVQKALGGLENALLDVKAKALGVPVHELFGGPLRDDVRLYWSHCGTTRVRAAGAVGADPVTGPEDLTNLAREVVARGYSGLKTNVLVLGEKPFVYMPGFNKSTGGPDRNPDPAIIEALHASLEAFAAGLPAGFDLIVDLNFNFRPEGFKRVVRALEDLPLTWVELDLYDPAGLREIKDFTSIAVCSGENLYGLRDFLPFLSARSFDVGSIDVIWNGFAQSLKIAHCADAHGINVSPHNYYSHLASFIGAQFCAAIPNVRLMETDVDDVPWKEELVTHRPEVSDGRMAIPDRPGWGTDLDEEVLAAHPWPG